MNPIIFLVLFAGYLIGSFPTAYLLGKIIRGIDIREHGSGNVGATNVLRVLGKKWGIIALLADIFKGALAVLTAILFLSPNSSPYYSWILLAAGIAAILGHLFPVWLKFKGGKGVAVGAGIFFVLTPLEMSICFIVFILILVLTRYVSLASMITALTLPVLIYLNLSGDAWSIIQPFFIVSLIIALLIVVMHGKNLQRLIAGTENKIFSSKKDAN